MIARLVVPQLDANILDVTVTAWRVAPGVRVKTDDVVAELTTDKATFELEATASGTVLAILAAEKSVVPAGYILALLGDPGEADPDAAVVNRALMEAYRAAGGQKTEAAPLPLPGRDTSASQPGTKNQEPSTSPPPPSTLHPPPANTPTARIRATPRARRLAQEHGLNLVRIQAETGVEVVDENALRPYLPPAAPKPGA